MCQQTFWRVQNWHMHLFEEIKMNKAEIKYKVLSILSTRVGRNKAINMVDLYTEVFGGPPKTSISGTREIRKVVEMLRREGLPICSFRGKGENGYYLAAAGVELEEYCRRLRREALKKLAMEAKLRKQTLPQLLGEIALNIQAIETEKE